jgi:Domain of unknown function (DUF6048)
MLKYSFSIFFLVISFLGNAQEVITIDSTSVKKDSIKPKTERYGLRVGVDLFKLTRSFYEEDYRGIELVGDFKLTRKHYIAAEIGTENKTVDDDRLNFTTKGTYLKAGFDYNGYENWLGMNNMLYVGMRYGISSFSQTLNSYTIYNPNPYFGQAPEIPKGEKYSGLTAQWIEVVAGAKAEMFKNFYVGMSVRLNYLVSNKKPDGFDNLYIPGFNRTYDGKFGVGLNYTISYFVPIFKTEVKPKEGKKK